MDKLLNLGDLFGMFNSRYRQDQATEKPETEEEREFRRKKAAYLQELQKQGYTLDDKGTLVPIDPAVAARDEKAREIGMWEGIAAPFGMGKEAFGQAGGIGFEGGMRVAPEGEGEPQYGQLASVPRATPSPEVKRQLTKKGNLLAPGELSILSGFMPTETTAKGVAEAAKQRGAGLSGENQEALAKAGAIKQSTKEKEEAQKRGYETVISKDGSTSIIFYSEAGMENYAATQAKSAYKLISAAKDKVAEIEKMISQPRFAQMHGEAAGLVAEKLRTMAAATRKEVEEKPKEGNLPPFSQVGLLGSIPAYGPAAKEAIAGGVEAAERGAGKFLLGEPLFESLQKFATQKMAPPSPGEKQPNLKKILRDAKIKMTPEEAEAKAKKDPAFKKMWEALKRLAMR